MKIRMLKQCLAMVAGALLLCGCSATRHLPEGAYMLNKVRVVTDSDYHDINTLALKESVRQKGNTRWLSTVKVPLAIHSLAGRDSNWVNRILWAIGEAPVVMDTTMARLSCEDLKQALANLGYLDAEVALYVEYKKRKANLMYLLRPGTAYKISQYETDIQDSVIEKILQRRNSTLYAGKQFSAEALNTERSQVTSYLQDRGYFRFHKEFINYRARRHQAEKTVDLMLVLQGCAENSVLPVGSLAQQTWVTQRLVLRSATLCHHVIIEFSKLAQIQHVDALGLALPCHHTVIGEFCFTRLTMLSGNQHDTVSTLGTIDGCCRGILQNLHRDDVRGVDGRKGRHRRYGTVTQTVAQTYRST